LFSSQYPFLSNVSLPDGLITHFNRTEKRGSQSNKKKVINKLREKNDSFSTGRDSPLQETLSGDANREKPV
jgi:hypothetical protein